MCHCQYDEENRILVKILYYVLIISLIFFIVISIINISKQRQIEELEEKLFYTKEKRKRKRFKKKINKKLDNKKLDT